MQLATPAQTFRYTVVMFILDLQLFIKNIIFLSFLINQIVGFIIGRTRGKQLFSKIQRKADSLIGRVQNNNSNMLETNPQISLQGSQDTRHETNRTAGQTSISAANERCPTQQQLLVRMLMLTIEIDRKDAIIQELQTTLSNCEQHEIINQLSQQCQKYEADIALLDQTVATLRDTIVEMDSFKKKDTLTTVNQINEELEDKVRVLETSLRKQQEEKIELQQSLKRIKLNQSMAEYQLIKNEQNQKAKVRELETCLINERTRVEAERRASIDKSKLIDELRSKVIELQNREGFIVQQYEDRIRLMQSQMAYNDSMKTSQIESTEQKISVSTQQINRLKYEIYDLKQTVEEMRKALQFKEGQVGRSMEECKSLEMRCFRQQSELRENNAKLEGKAQQILHKDREIQQKDIFMQGVQGEIDTLKLALANKQQEVEMFYEDVNRLKAELSDLYNQLDSHKIQMRRLKRKSNAHSLLCESCKIRESGSSISSQRSVAMVDMSEIIEQTQALIRSNERIQSLITQRQMTLDSLVYVKSGQNW